MKRFEKKENTHIVLKFEDIEKYLGEFEQSKLLTFLEDIRDGRLRDGKRENNEYYLCNRDEHYVQGVFNLIKEKTILRDVVRNDLIALGEEDEWFAIEREVFGELFNQLDAMRPSYSGFDEEELMKLLLIDFNDEMIGEGSIDVEVKEWYLSVETPMTHQGEEVLHYPRDIENQGKYLTFHCWFDLK